MKFTTQLFVAASAFLVMACTQENNNTTAETATADDLTVNAPASAQPATTTTDPNQPQITAEAPQTANQPVAAGMNPPHGQPGHRCDIEVGAPLNSAPEAAPQANPTITTTPPPSTNPNINTSPVFNAPASQPVAAGMNPPHGQPGHDCGIPVGAPLKK